MMILSLLQIAWRRSGTLGINAMTLIPEIVIDSTLFISILYIALLPWDLLSHMAQATELLVPQSILAAEPILFMDPTQNWDLCLSLNEESQNNLSPCRICCIENLNMPTMHDAPFLLIEVQHIIRCPFSRKLDPKYFTYLAGNFVEFIFHFLEFLYLIVVPRALVTSYLSSSYCLVHENIDIMDQCDILWNVQMVWITSDYTATHSRRSSDLGEGRKCYYHLLHINMKCF